MTTNSPTIVDAHGCSLARRLFHRLAGSAHYHLGWQVGDEPVGEAMERLSRHCTGALPRGRILDVGCALGGTAVLLAADGNDVTAIDVCARTIHGARRHHATSAVHWVAADLAEFAAGGPEPFDGVVMIEALQGFRHVPELLRAIQRLLRPGGIAVIADTAILPSVPFERVPFHPRGALAAAATQARLQVVRQQEVTRHVAPSLDRLVALLRRSRTRLAAELRDHGAAVHAACDELEIQLRALSRGFAHGDLFYEITVLRC